MADSQLIRMASSTQLHLTVSTGEIVSLPIQERDRYDNLATKGVEPFIATIEPSLPSDDASPPPIARSMYRGSGMYSVWFKLLQSGTYNVTVKLRGVEINGSPVRVDAEKAALQSAGARQSRILGRVTSVVGEVGSVFRVKLQTRDPNGRICALRNVSLTLSIADAHSGTTDELDATCVFPRLLSCIETAALPRDLVDGDHEVSHAPETASAITNMP